MTGEEEKKSNVLPQKETKSELQLNMFASGLNNVVFA